MATLVAQGKEATVKVREFESFMQCLLRDSGRDDIESVTTFGDAGITSKPVGLRVRFRCGSQIFLQVVRTSGPGVSPKSQPDYHVPPDML